jgi:PAP2 superfamily
VRIHHSPELYCNQSDVTSPTFHPRCIALLAGTRKAVCTDKMKMIRLKTNANTNECYTNDHKPARAGTTRAAVVRRVSPFLLGLSVLLLAGAGLTAADEVTDWNHILLEATLTPPATPPPVSTRSAAIVQAAVFDAVNGIDPHYTSIFVRHIGPRHGSQRAAAVQAAYAILIRLYPAQLDALDQQRSASLWGIARGWGAEHSESIQKGVEWGQAVAEAIWDWRSNDGFGEAPPPFTGGTAPGEWRPTPPAFAPGLVPQLAHVTPWVIKSPSQFRPPAPPAVDSATYAMDFNETKLMGSSTSANRATDQTEYALFWQAGNPPNFWDPVAISLADKHHFSLLQTARLLAQLNVAMSDSIIGCWDAKYTYAYWRPITAITLADTDGNPDTVPEPAWTPLVITPPFPEYPSAHSCASGAAARVLSHYFGEETPITVTTAALPGQMRTFPSFTAAVDEVKDARVFGGIHFRTACDAGQALGNSVANYVLKHSLGRIDGCDWCDGRRNWDR